MMLPPGNVQIALSGGRTSAYMLHEILEANGFLPDRVKICFQNTGREMPETLDFVHEIESRWGVFIAWLEYRGDKPWYERVDRKTASQNGEPFDVLIQKKQMLPNIAMRFCTSELKVKTARRYCRALGWQDWTTARGIRADEAHRARPSKDKVIRHWHPLVDAGTTKQDVLDFWGRQSFDLKQKAFGNCDGCFLKSEASKADLIRQHPERAEWWINHEERMGRTFRDGLSLKELSNFIDRQGDWIFDETDALCQSSDGECL